MKEVMLHKENPLTGDWLCWIPDTPQAYYYPTKKKAKEFCDKVNNAFEKGELKFNEEGRVVKVNVANFRIYATKRNTMYISKKNREIIKMKFDGKCAYSGTELDTDWQIDHIKPVVRNWFEGTMIYRDNDCFENMIPVQKIINHYKHSISLEEFRTWLLGGLHIRLKKLPKKPRTEKGKKRKEYLLKVAEYFGITEDTPFNGIFYFETLKD